MLIGPQYSPENPPADEIVSYMAACHAVELELPHVNTLHPAAIYVIRLTEAATQAQLAYDASENPEAPTHIYRAELTDERRMVNKRQEIAISIVALVDILKPGNFNNLSTEEQRAVLSGYASAAAAAQRAKIKKPIFSDEERLDLAAVIYKTEKLFTSKLPFVKQFVNQSAPKAA